MNKPLPYSEACARNQEPIARVLAEHLPETGRVLEVGSGTGQHVVCFAGRFPGLEWQPTDAPGDLEGLIARVEQEGRANVGSPLELDAARLPWPVGPVDVVYTANTAHIMSWPTVLAMVSGAAGVLTDGGLLVIYGPFTYAGKHTASSNASFDVSLKSRDPAMGIRDAFEIVAEGRKHGLELLADHPMPANNRTLIFRKNP